MAGDEMLRVLPSDGLRQGSHAANTLLAQRGLPKRSRGEASKFSSDVVQDFEHNTTMWSWCDTYQAAPSADECNSNGCEGNEWHCHCETKESCLAVGRVGLHCRRPTVAH